MKRFTTHLKVTAILAALAVVATGATVHAATKTNGHSRAAQKQPLSPDEIDRLIKQLGDKDYYVRQKAQEGLARVGFEAFDALNAATTSDDLEISSRAKYLLRLMRVEWTIPSDPEEVKKCLQDYEFEDAKLRETRMQILAAMPEGLGVNALCRLIRFEKSSLLSKTAAVTFLTHEQPGDAVNPSTIETIRKNLQGCNRPGAVWMLAWTRLVHSPEAEIGPLAKLVDQEARVLKQSQSESAPEIVTGLTRFQVAWLKKLGKRDEIPSAIDRLVQLERGNTETLGPLLEWLVNEKAWKNVDDLAKRFAGKFAAESSLLYALAESYAAQGKKDLSEQTASRALHLHPGKQDEQLLRHLRVGVYLKNRGLFSWARREFEHVIAQGNADLSEVAIMAITSLAEMLHDQGQELDAAKAMEKIVQGLDAGKVNEAELYGRQPQEVRSRTLYFHACHWASQNDATKQREYLDKALEADPTDVDALIAGYRLQGQPAEYHSKIVDLIKKAAAKLREEIAAEPDSATSYNQYAWLIGNTEGDFDEAIRFSHKSIELQPSEGGYYDTLAHAYAGKGDLKNAVKYQLKAAELDPHSGLVQKELVAFRKKLEEAQKK